MPLCPGGPLDGSGPLGYRPPQLDDPFAPLDPKRAGDRVGFFLGKPKKELAFMV
jgi:hypothetical protein